MYVLIVAGASGSGKSTLVKLLSNVIKGKGMSTLVIAMDQYYRSMKPGEPLNWDHFSAIDADLLLSDLRKLIAGQESIKIPSYDYVTHQRIPEAIETGIPDVLILEGIFALYDPRIRELANLKIYVEADPIKLCFKRRFHRDVAERGRSGDSVITQYFEQVLPGYEEFVVTSRPYADFVWPNEGTMPTEDTPFIRAVALCIEHIL